MTEDAVDAGDDVLLRVEDLSTHLRTRGGTVHAVDGVSFALPRGQTLGVVGESGSGKSMLARSIIGLLPAEIAHTTGRVVFEGRDLVGLDERALRAIWGKRVATIFQDPMTALNPVVRIERQIVEGLTAHLGLTRSDARDRARELLVAVGISDPDRRLRSYPHHLSGGLRQRVSIAIALSCRPPLLIADEPTTALDVTVQRQVLDLLDVMKQELDMSTILITHNMGVVAGRSDLIAVMYAGQVVEFGRTKDVFAETRHPYTAALLASIPRVDGSSRDRLAVIPGSPRVVVDPGPGCRFVTRCERAGPECATKDPPARSTPDGTHSFLCHYPLGDDLADRSRPLTALPTVSRQKS